MKLFNKILLPIACLSIAVCTPYSAFAESSVSAISEADSANAYYAEQVLDSPLTPGLRVMAYDRPMILSGMTGEKIQFSADAFDEYNGYVPSSIKIISVPSSDSGTLVYNSEPVKEGQSISVLSLNSLYYESNEAVDSEFLLSADNSNIIRCVMRHKDSENSKPSAFGDDTVTTFTKLNTAVSGYLNGTDIDGDSISYEIVSGPAKGIISAINDATGQFVYEPYTKMSGNDSFTYRVRDSYGAYSDNITVNLRIDDQKAVVYKDMNDSYSTSAVNDVVKMGVMQVSNSTDGEYFNPHEPVSRIDFLIMAMKTMGAGDASAVSSTPFADDSTLSDTEKGYLSAAYKLGIINGSVENGKLKFNPDEAVTGASAAVILNGILGLKPNSTQEVISSNADIPSWASSAFCALTEAGILNEGIAPCDSALTRENVAVILSQIIHKLA